MEPKDSSENKQKSDSTLDDAIAKVPTPVSVDKSGFPLTDPKSNKKTDKPKHKRHWLRWSFILLILLAVAAGLFYLTRTNKVVISFGNFTTFSRVCGDDVQQRFYNEYGQEEINRENLGIIYNEIISNENYLEDADCAHIAFAYGAYITGNVEIAQTALDALERLSGRNLNPSNEFTSVARLSTMQNAVKTMNMKETVEEDATAEQ
ncbi:hypothetical protein FWG95_04760 [Candidatus Saccharibacteria bacterium]|nr:hypothetical protein [Candidatus Saccharibacteria bacterium]